MPKLEIHPFSEDFREPAAALLADRHARHRAAEPLLPEIDDFAAQIPDGTGAVATRGGEVVAYVIATVGPERAEIGLAGCAASEPEAVRDLYAHLAPRWPVWHQALIPASDAALVDTWFRLACGLQFTTAVRDLSPLEVPAFSGTIRPSTPDDLQATADFDRLLWTHLSASPSFSGMNVEAEDFESEWSTLWEETDEFPYHRVAELDGRIVGHILLFNRPTGDLRVPEQNIDLAHAATLEDARGSGAMLALTAGAIDWAREQGFRSFTTDWRIVNLEASRYWPRRGWRPTFYRLVRAVPPAPA
jgi:GNAT superfamily N-acetyltransferase